MKVVRFVLAMALVTTGCNQIRHAVPSYATTAIPSAEPERLIPLVDHHAHLLSPAGAALQTPEPLTEVALPRDLAALIKARSESWNNRTGLAPLYKEDGILLSGEGAGWIRGREDIARYVSTRFSRAYRLNPVAFGRNGNGGYVAGYYSRPAAGGERRFGQFYLDLSYENERGWIISAETTSFPGPPVSEPHTAEQLVANMDALGIRRAVVFSTAYYVDSLQLVTLQQPGPEVYPLVRSENDWTAEQVMRFPDRLVAFCGVNPLMEHAIPEIERCRRNPAFKGLKLHLNGAGADLTDPEHIQKLQRVFATANRLGFAIAIHVSALSAGPYGKDQAEGFLQVLSAAPDVVVQIAHLWGGDAYSDAALAVYADAVQSGDPRTRRLYFDLGDVGAGSSEEDMQKAAAHIRRIGLGRILWGSDGNPRQKWNSLRVALPLANEEFRIIGSNVAPYLR